MLKSACAAFPTWLLNVRDLTHLMSFLSFWKFFPESLSCLLMCHLTAREWGSRCTWTQAPLSRGLWPQLSEGSFWFPLLNGSCYLALLRPTTMAKYSGWEVGGLRRSEVSEKLGGFALITSQSLLFPTFLDLLPVQIGILTGEAPSHLLGDAG